MAVLGSDNINHSTTFNIKINAIDRLRVSLNNIQNTATPSGAEAFGFLIPSGYVGATQTFGFYGNIPDGTNRWNFFAGGTAENFFKGAVRVGETTLTVDSKSIGAGEIQSRRNTNDPVTHFRFFAPAGQAGVINTTGATTEFASSSDYRLKENIEDAPDASSDIDDINVRSFNWKYDGRYQKYGFIAQELVNIIPDAVIVGSETEMWSVDNSKMVPMLVKEIQSLRQRISNLETMVGN
jgi:hypothetical protein